MPTTRKTRRRPLWHIRCVPPGWYNPRLEIERSIMPFRDLHGRRRVLPAGAAHALAPNGRQRAERHGPTRAARARFAANRDARGRE